jgi:hypothetical protein
MDSRPGDAELLGGLSYGVGSFSWSPLSATLLIFRTVARFGSDCTHIVVPLVPALTFKMLNQIYVLVVFLLNVC